jgi:D-amino-acid dehydrogenase
MRQGGSSPDVVVVGGGAIGAATAYELTQRGASVTVLERSHVALGCSYGNAGLICPSHAEALANPAAIRSGLAWMTRRDSPFHVRPRLSLVPWLVRFGLAARPGRSAPATAALRALAAESLEAHERLVRNGLPTSFERRGILSVFESAAALDAAERNGAEPLTAAAARELEPALAPTIAGALFHSGEAHCDPALYVAALLEAARERGAELHRGVEVLGLRAAGGRIDRLDTTAGPLRAGAVVLAAGTWTRRLARDVGVNLPLEGAKGYHLEVTGGPLRAGIPIYMEEARVIATPLNGRLRLAGTLELAGLDMSVDPVRLDALGDAARRTLTLPHDSRVVGVWRGLRPCPPDGLPAIGRAPGVEDLFLATGHAMLGITLAPATAEIVASQVQGTCPAHDTAPFDPSRFAGVWGTMQRWRRRTRWPR